MNSIVIVSQWAVNINNADDVTALDFIILDDITKLNPKATMPSSYFGAKLTKKSFTYYSGKETFNFRTCKKTCSYRLTPDQYNWLILHNDRLTLCESKIDNGNRRWVEYSNARLLKTRGLSRAKTWMIYDFEYEYESSYEGKMDNIECLYKQTIRDRILNDLI